MPNTASTTSPYSGSYRLATLINVLGWISFGFAALILVLGITGAVTTTDQDVFVGALLGSAVGGSVFAFGGIVLQGLSGLLKATIDTAKHTAHLCP